MKNPKHCDHYVTRDEPCYNLKQGDCTRPINGRWQPGKCKKICKHFTDTAHRLKKLLGEKEAK